MQLSLISADLPDFLQSEQQYKADVKRHCSSSTVYQTNPDCKALVLNIADMLSCDSINCYTSLSNTCFFHTMSKVRKRSLHNKIQQSTER